MDAAGVDVLRIPFDAEQELRIDQQPFQPDADALVEAPSAKPVS